VPCGRGLCTARTRWMGSTGCLHEWRSASYPKFVMWREAERLGSRGFSGCSRASIVVAIGPRREGGEASREGHIPSCSPVTVTHNATKPPSRERKTCELQSWPGAVKLKNSAVWVAFVPLDEDHRGRVAVLASGCPKRGRHDPAPGASSECSGRLLLRAKLSHHNP